MRKGLHYGIERAIVLGMGTTKQTSKPEEAMRCYRCGHQITEHADAGELCVYCEEAEEVAGSACDESCGFCGRCS